MLPWKLISWPLPLRLEATISISELESWKMNPLSRNRPALPVSGKHVPSNVTKKTFLPKTPLWRNRGDLLDLHVPAKRHERQPMTKKFVGQPQFSVTKTNPKNITSKPGTISKMSIWVMMTMTISPAKRPGKPANRPHGIQRETETIAGLAAAVVAVDVATKDRDNRAPDSRAPARLPAAPEEVEAGKEGIISHVSTTTVAATSLNPSLVVRAPVPTATQAIPVDGEFPNSNRMPLPAKLL